MAGVYSKECIVELNMAASTRSFVCCQIQFDQINNIGPSISLFINKNLLSPTLFLDNPILIDI